MSIHHLFHAKIGVTAASAHREFARRHRAHWRATFLHRFVGYTPSPYTTNVAVKGFTTLVGRSHDGRARGIFEGRSSPAVAFAGGGRSRPGLSGDPGDQSRPDRDAVLRQFLRTLVEVRDPSDAPA